MTIDSRVRDILGGAIGGKAPSREDCVWLLEFPEQTLEASMLRAVADSVARRRFSNRGMLLGQIGIETAPCPADCAFCVFGEGHTEFERVSMTSDEVLLHARNLTAGGDLYALFLMLMHECDFERLLNTVSIVRGNIPGSTQIVVNIGDFDLAQADELKSAGVNGAYHVLRLREGMDTGLSPATRISTIEVIKEAGLDWYYCCEPIGPEHSSQEIVDQIYLGAEHGCFQHAAMRRVWIPEAPLAGNGQISELRLGQVVAVVALAMLENESMTSIAVHEPNLIGLSSGANTVYAESGANPRDKSEDTSKGRGNDIHACKTMLYEAGFNELISTAGTLSLNDVYKS